MIRRGNYVSTWSEFAYVAVVTDAYARRILGWRVVATNPTTQRVRIPLAPPGNRSSEAIIYRSCVLRQDQVYRALPWHPFASALAKTAIMVAVAPTLEARPQLSASVRAMPALF
jgi:hypothetical protein